MATFREWITRLWGALHPNRRDAELEQELRLHLDLAADDERRRANSAEGAGRAAVIRFGGTAQAMEALRDQRGLPWFEDLARDARYGLRSLCRTPVFAIVVLLTLAIGIGANTAVFSVVNAVLLKPLSYPNSEALVGSGTSRRAHGGCRPSPATCPCRPRCSSPMPAKTARSRRSARGRRRPRV